MVRASCRSATRGGLPTRIAERLREAGIDVAVRAGALRMSPTVYNDEDDVRTLVSALLSEGRLNAPARKH